MFRLAWRVPKKTEADRTIELEEFLRNVPPRVDDEPAPRRDEAPRRPPPLGLDERLDEALSETFPASDPIAVSPA